MRSEVKLAILVGLFVIAGAITWTVLDSRNSEKQAATLPLNLTGQDKKPGPSAAAPAGPNRPAGRGSPIERPTTVATPPPAGRSDPASAALRDPQTRPAATPPRPADPAPTRPMPPLATNPPAMPGTTGSTGAAPTASGDGGTASTDPPRPPPLPMVTPRDSNAASPAGASPTAPPVTTAPPPSPSASPKPLDQPPPPAGAADRPTGTGSTPPAPRVSTPPPPAGSPPTAKPGPVAAPAAADTHAVEEGETLSQIAREKYGDDKFWVLIRDANPGINPNRLLVGQKLKLPPRDASGPKDAAAKPAEPASAKPDLARPGVAPPGKPEPPKPDARPPATDTYVVEKGDSLRTIAGKLLGSEDRWREIFNLNKDRLQTPDQIQAGMSLKVPAKKDAKEKNAKPKPKGDEHG